MNEQQLKVLEEWIAAERQLRKSMKEARQPGASAVQSENALKAFQDACNAGGKAFDMLREAFGPTL